MSGKIIIAGGGPAGMMAAIAAKGKNKENEVLLLERNHDLGRKLLLTGNGRCNLSNENLSVSRYNEDTTGILKEILSEFDTDALKEFFLEIGLLTQSVNEGVYPYTNQAKTVLDVLKIRLGELGVKVLCDCYLTGVEKKEKGYVVTYIKNTTEDKGKDTSGKEKEESAREYCDSLILACGGKAAPSTGSDGNGFKFARNLGLTVSNTYPVLVQLKSDFNKDKLLSGVRCRASVRGLISGQNGIKKTKEHFGELQITDYGISGIVIFNLSRELSKPVEDGLSCEVLIDFLPDYSMEELKSFIEIRRKNCESLSISEFFTGLLNEKLLFYLFDRNHIKHDDTLKNYSSGDLCGIMEAFKEFRISVYAHNGYNNAQATQGGVLLSNLNEDLESVENPGLYFAGEMLDVDGECGGYNLQWAFASGFRAGLSAGAKL